LFKEDKISITDSDAYIEIYADKQSYKMYLQVQVITVILLHFKIIWKLIYIYVYIYIYIYIYTHTYTHTHTQYIQLYNHIYTIYN